MPASERTVLPADQEARFQRWALANGITDVDQPQSYYDYRGYWKEFGDKPIAFGKDHFSDTYKQHGHPTFSQESQYSRGPSDGGMWLNDDTLLTQPPMAVSHSDPYQRIRQMVYQQLSRKR